MFALVYTENMTNALSQVESKTARVPWNLDGKRFDVVAQTLTNEWFTPNLSRSILQSAISNHTILLDGSHANPSERLSKGDQILFTEDFFKSVVQKEERIAPKSEEPKVISQNESLIVLYKPAGWLTHEVSDYQEEASLEDWLLKKHLIPVGLPSNGRIHRLDRNTSGLIVFAKSVEAQEALKSLFQERKVEKRYVALVKGNLSELTGTINAPIMRKYGSFKRVVSEDLSDPAAKEAETEYRVVGRTERHDLLILSPKTGRTHQIRVHMAHIGHPLVNDNLYGGNNQEKGAESRQFLHAFSLKFNFQGQDLQFLSPLPADLKNTLAALDGSTLTRYDNEALKSIGLKQKSGFFSLFTGLTGKN